MQLLSLPLLQIFVWDYFTSVSCQIELKSTVLAAFIKTMINLKILHFSRHFQGYFSFSRKKSFNVNI